MQVCSVQTGLGFSAPPQRLRNRIRVANGGVGFKTNPAQRIYLKENPAALFRSASPDLSSGLMTGDPSVRNWTPVLVRKHAARSVPVHTVLCNRRGRKVTKTPQATSSPSLTGERMAAPMWRMNGLWRRMAGVLVLCALLLSNEVMCQDDSPVDATAAPAADSPGDVSAATDAADAGADAGASAPPDVGAAPTVGAGGEPAATPAPGDVQVNVVTVPGKDVQDGDTSGTSGTTAAPVGRADAAPPAEAANPPTVPLVVPDVKCVGKEDIPEGSAVKLEVATNDCETTKDLIQTNPAPWCNTDKCDLKVFQDGNLVQIASDDAQLSTVAKVLQGEALKDKLGVTNVEAPSSSSGSSVFVGLLVSGLLAAVAITVGYCKCQRRPDDKGVRLAEEAHPADQENQGNTLVSVAPLNPPPETQEKPSVNGESPEAAKTQPPPPTNGHSTTKTADTEL
ncbi:uncharacterized protein si:dkey-261h17.1 isoform X2 [Acanthopagrus latus]|uniref:uncharacterized protein si:dkey-261h17.1 isoform X2 n=1 Tax=Acanthopagrus latus TaxID=8177 RepID=UPI00187C30E3|nr:uncharacterized protein si:dkey-261h17.1 isoform X2 [Acanthopagrus latus]